MNEGEIQGQFFVFLKNIYLFILVVLGLSCGTWDLHCSMRDLLVAACRLLAVACGLLVVACMWDLVPRPGIELRPPALGAWSLTHWTTREVPKASFEGDNSFTCEILRHFLD